MGLLTSVHRYSKTKINISLRGLIFAMIVFLVAVVLTQLQFNNSNDRARDALQAQQDRDRYIAAVINYNNEVNIFNACIEGVSRSDLNRGQHETLVDVIGEFVQDPTIRQAVIDRLQAGPLLSAKPRSISECDKPGIVPIAPVGVIVIPPPPGENTGTVVIPVPTQVQPGG